MVHGEKFCAVSFIGKISNGRKKKKTLSFKQLCCTVQSMCITRKCILHVANLLSHKTAAAVSAKCSVSGISDLSDTYKHNYLGKHFTTQWMNSDVPL